MNKLKTVAILFGMACFLSNNALAQSQEQDRRGQKERPTFAQLLEKMDADDDGKLAKDEVKGRLQKNFDKLDADSDGFLSSEEFDEAPKFKKKGRKQNERGERGERPTFSHLLERMDADDDGKLAKEEVRGRLKQHFDKLDVNEDGFITEEEFKKAPKPKRRGGNN